MHIQSGTGSSY